MEENNKDLFGGTELLEASARLADQMRWVQFYELTDLVPAACWQFEVALQWFILPRPEIIRRNKRHGYHVWLWGTHFEDLMIIGPMSFFDGKTSKMLHHRVHSGRIFLYFLSYLYNIQLELPSISFNEFWSLLKSLMLSIVPLSDHHWSLIDMLDTWDKNILKCILEMHLI